MTEAQKAYIAGLIDADGCISVFTPSKGSGAQIRISLANQDMRPLQMLQQEYGGYISVSGQTCRAWNNRNYAEAKAILSDITPYLMIKKDRAVLALEFIGLDVGKGGITTEANKVPRLRRKEIAREISSINQGKRIP